MLFRPSPVQEEWSSLTAAVDEAFTSSAFPAFPCSFTVMCLPCLPLFVMCHRASQRRRKLECVAAKENARLMPQGLEWILTPNRQRNMNMVAVLRWNPDRLEFEAANPHRRPVSRQPLPTELLPPELRAQLAMADMATRVFAMQAQQAAAMGMAPPHSMGMSVGRGTGAPAAPLAPEHQFMEMQPYPPQQQQQQQQFGDQQPRQQLQSGQQQSGLIYANPSAASAYHSQAAAAHGQAYAPPVCSARPPQLSPQADASGVLHVRAAPTQASAPHSAGGTVFPNSSSSEGLLQSPSCAAAARTDLAPCPRCGVVTDEAEARICARCGSPVDAAPQS